MVRALEGLKSQLDQLDDQVSVAIQMLEKALHSLNLRVPISTIIENSSSDNCRTELLAYVKYARTWRLVIKMRMEDEEPEDWVVTPLTDCPRDKRANVLENYAQALIKSAIEALQDKIDQRTRILQTANMLLASIESKK